MPMSNMWCRVLVLLLLKCLTTIHSEDVHASNTEDEDFRYISYNDLLASGSAQFTEQGVTSYSQILFDVARNQLFVGARDTLYRLSLRDLSLLEKAAWPAPHDKVTMCQDKGQSESACHNYVKVLLSDGERLFTCGTNAFSPQCSYRQLDNLGNVTEWVRGVGNCPYNPAANITSLLTVEGQYYVGSPTDFSSSDPAIYRTLGKARTLRTKQYNSKWLNEPQFVGSFEDDDHVYFVFREPAVEYINCGKRVYSRIARVCKADPGGQLVLRDNWTSFVKARLNCSLPGEYPFYYDEVQGVEYLPEERLLYATFTTPSNSIAGSAICVYNMSSIAAAFSGPYKHQESPASAWESRVAPHATCPPQGHKWGPMWESSRHQLMDLAVQPLSPRPLHTSYLERLTHLAVAVVASKRGHSHVLFVANERGVVRKLATLPGGDHGCLLEVWQPQEGQHISTIKTMKYLKETESLYLGRDEGVLRVPAARCARHASLGACLGAQDPQCGWDEGREQCTSQGGRRSWLQNPPACPSTHMPMDGGWSAWSPWEVCLQKGEREGEASGEETMDKCLCQTRRCDNPHPRNGGKTCKGIGITVSNCTVHGGWTAWSGWSSCSASCGVAVKWRRRSCGAPAPRHGGRLCVGADKQEIYCTQNPPCPGPVEAVAEAAWSVWGPWSACSSACGGGARWRSRRCDSPAAEPCRGCAQEHEPCNTQPCPSRRTSVWTPWLANTGNASDGSYVEKRFKVTCKAQTSDLIKISLSKEEERSCSGVGLCVSSPVTESSPGWSPWGEWDACSAACGGGYQTATRSCLLQPCEGSSKMQRACNTHSCIDGWGCWSEWSTCSSSCGLGSRERRRSCLAPAGCPGDSTQRAHCEGPPCESFVGWSAWSPWSACDADDLQHRQRKCLMRSLSSELEVCQGPDKETRSCAAQETDNMVPPVAAPAPAPAPAPGSALLLQSSSVLPLLLLLLLALLLGALLAAAPACWRARRCRARPPALPASPHYLSQQNSYVSVPLKEVPKKRQTSFSCPSRDSSSGLTLSKANNISSDRDREREKERDRASPKLFPKAIAAEYETATMKRNAHASRTRNNLDLGEDKFY